MMSKTLAVLCCTAALTVPVFAGDTTKAPSCCAKKAAAEQTAQKMRCSLTGKVVDKCCCTRTNNGKFHCTLAGKDVDKCCCTPVSDGEQGKESTAR